MISERIDILVGDGIEIAALGAEDDHEHNDRVALARAVKNLGTIAALEAIAQGATTLLELNDAVQLDPSERIELAAVTAALKLAAYRLRGSR